jgi:phosphoglycerate dehydrogenase-like enzyme
MEKTIEMLITLQLDESLLEKIRQVSEQINIHHYPVKQASEIPDEVWNKTQVLYTYRVIPEPGKAPNLRWLQYDLAGVDKLLEFPLVQKEGLIITTLSGANAVQVAEHALAMLLALCRRFPTLMELQLKNQWMSDKTQRYKPQELRGSTVGIVGYGSVGRQIARLLSSFDVKILAAKRDVMHPEYIGYMPEKNMGDPQADLLTRLYPIEALRSMFSECDYVFITLPLTEKTRGIVGKSQLEALKPGAMLVDVSRGGVLDLQALTGIMQEGKLGGAGLDVFPDEPLPTDSPLWKLPNVLISPHVAGFSQSYSQNAVALFVENLKRYLNGQSLYNQLDIERGY